MQIHPRSQFFDFASPVSAPVGVVHGNQFAARVELELPHVPTLPVPLEVCILDKRLEREQRTTAVLIRGFGFRDYDQGYDMIVPEGFETDFASIPSLLQAFISPFGLHAKAAVLHDWLYSVGEKGEKPFADNVFLHAMVRLGVEPWKRQAMYSAVHLFGGGAYNRAEQCWKESFAGVQPQRRVAPPAAREKFFKGTPFGIRPIPADDTFPPLGSPWPLGGSPVIICDQ